MTTRKTFNIKYVEYREAGDDPINARMRLIDFDGATEAEAAEAQTAAGESDDWDEDMEPEDAEPVPARTPDVQRIRTIFVIAKYVTKSHNGRVHCTTLYLADTPTVEWDRLLDTTRMFDTRAEAQAALDALQLTERRVHVARKTYEFTDQ